MLFVVGFSLGVQALLWFTRYVLCLLFYGILSNMLLVSLFSVVSVYVRVCCFCILELELLLFIVLALLLSAVGLVCCSTVFFFLGGGGVVW